MYSVIFEHMYILVHVKTSFSERFPSDNPNRIPLRIPMGFRSFVSWVLTISHYWFLCVKRCDLKYQIKQCVVCEIQVLFFFAFEVISNISADNLRWRKGKNGVGYTEEQQRSPGSNCEWIKVLIFQHEKRSMMLLGKICHILIVLSQCTLMSHGCCFLCDCGWILNGDQNELSLLLMTEGPGTALCKIQNVKNRNFVKVCKLYLDAFWPLQRNNSCAGACYSGEMYTFSVQNYSDSTCNIVFSEFRTGNAPREDFFFFFCKVTQFVFKHVQVYLWTER